MIQSLLIANRGEIACRIIRTARNGAATALLGATLTACTQNPANAEPLKSATIRAGETERTYSFYIAPACAKANAECPILLGFHGGGVPGVSGKQFERSGDWVAAAKGRDVIMVFPDAIDNNWNDGRPEVGGNRDDVGFVRALIAQVRKDNPGADATRVYATGMSNGGHLSFRLACEMPETITAIAPVAASLSLALSKRCAPANPVPVLNIVGAKDPISPAEGGQIKGGRGTVLSIADTLAFWQKANGCSGAVNEVVEGTVTTRVFERCNGQTQVRQLSIADGGHTWPGHPGAPASVRFVGETSMAFDATEVIFDFFGIPKAKTP